MGDWGNNAKARKLGKMHGSSARVHRGAYAYAVRLTHRLGDLVQAADYIEISGHSMGSMIAPIFAFRYRRFKDKLWTIRLTGAVPCGDVNFLHEYRECGLNGATTNVRTLFDFFVHIVAPFMRLFLGYHQVGYVIRKKVKNPFRLMYNHRYPQYLEYHRV